MKTAYSFSCIRRATFIKLGRLGEDETAHRFIYIPSFHPSLVIRSLGRYTEYTFAWWAVTKSRRKGGSEEPLDAHRSKNWNY